MFGDVRRDSAMFGDVRRYYPMFSDVRRYYPSFNSRSTDAPQFRKGHFTCMALRFVTAGMALSNPLVLGAINRRRDRLYGTLLRGPTVDVSELADKSPHFRFICCVLSQV